MRSHEDSYLPDGEINRFLIDSIHWAVSWAIQNRFLDFSESSSKCPVVCRVSCTVSRRVSVCVLGIFHLLCFSQ
jgi:hypothetical protein